MKKKIVTLCAALALCATAIIGGTLAYFTDTKTAENTFAVGKVAITLDEAQVNEMGEKVDETRVTGNEYKLIPGHTYKKDPTIHVANDSEKSYLFVKVENGIKAYETTDETKTIAAQMKANDWELLDGVDNVYYLEGTDGKPAVVSAGAEKIIFGNFIIDGDVTEIKAEDAKPITITAYAVQADGFADKSASEIWTAANLA